MKTAIDATRSPQAWAETIVRPLSRRYLAVLLAVAVLVVIDQAIIQPLLVNLNVYAPVINVAGRQRMLSQKVVKEVLVLAGTNTTGALGTEQIPNDVLAARRGELLRTVNQWTTAHRGLLDGNRELGLERVTSPAIVAALQAIEPHFETVRIAAIEIAQSDSPHDQTVPAPSLSAVLSHEAAYLRGMERVVALIQEAAHIQVAWLRWCGLIAMTLVLVLLASVYFFVLGPAARLIRDQVQQLAASENRQRGLVNLLREARDELEHRVVQRTSELSTANATVEREMRERLSAESRMRSLSAELAHASRVTALGQLATGLAHEINQPLAAITNYAETVELLVERTMPHDHRARQAVVQLKQAALRAGAIVRRMRDFVRPGPPHASSVELNDLVREVSELCRSELRQANVEVSTELTSQPSGICADALQIQQVLVNLIQNAIQSMSRTDPRQRRLRITTSVAAAEIRLELADSGPGFPAGEVERAFSPFFSTKPDGLGMGLAISRTIIEQYQGKLWAENNQSGGAMVAFSLPLRNAHEADRGRETHCLCG